MEINNSQVSATRRHNEVPGWHLHQTEDGRYWLDTTPGNNGARCSELSKTEFEAVAGAELRLYLIGDECVSDTVVHAEDMDQALELAKDWARDGFWDHRCEVDVFAVELNQFQPDGSDRYSNGRMGGDEVGDREWATVEVGEDPPEPECSEADGHDWQRPHEIVGGLSENPGVWSAGGTTMTFHSVCANCGLHKHETHVGAQRNPGQLDTVEYRRGDE
jgi:hypothetical protein